MGFACWHHQRFPCFQNIFFAVYRKFSGSFQYRHHGITMGRMGTDFFVFIKSKYGQTNSFILCQRFADNLPWLDADLFRQTQYTFMWNVFDISHGFRLLFNSYRFSMAIFYDKAILFSVVFPTKKRSISFWAISEENKKAEILTIQKIPAF